MNSDQIKREIIVSMLIQRKGNIGERILSARKNDNFPTSFHDTTLIAVNEKGNKSNYRVNTGCFNVSVRIKVKLSIIKGLQWYYAISKSRRIDNQFYTTLWKRTLTRGELFSRVIKKKKKCRDENKYTKYPNFPFYFDRRINFDSLRTVIV